MVNNVLKKRYVSEGQAPAQKMGKRLEQASHKRSDRLVTNT